MDAAETMATIDELTALAAQVAELQARLLSHADRIDLPAETGATSTANWHAHRTRTTRRDAHRIMRLATGLDQPRPHPHRARRGPAAPRTGRGHPPRTDRAPRRPRPPAGRAGRGAPDRPGRRLRRHRPRNLGRRLLEVVAPDAADAHEAKLLEREERDAAAADPADHLGRRPRQGPRPVHPRRPRPAPCSRRPCSRSPPPNTGPPRARSGNGVPPPNGSVGPSRS